MGALQPKSWLAVLAASLIAGCASIPQERIERDQAILAAVQPCVERHSALLYNTNLISVMPNGAMRYFYADRAVGDTYEFERCMAEARKELRLGPWKPGKLARPGPASVSTSSSGPEILVPVRINGVAGAMAVRRNTNLTSVTPSYARRAGLQIVTESPMTHVVEGGKTVVVPYARARVLEIGDAAVEALDIAVYDRLSGHPQVDGVLGNSFLGEFKVTVNRATARMTLEPK